MPRLGNARFQSGVAYLGTLRADRSPRVHPVTPIVDEQLFLSGSVTSEIGEVTPLANLRSSHLLV